MQAHNVDCGDGSGSLQLLAQAANLTRIRRDYIVFMPHALASLRFLEPSLAWLPLGAQYVVLGEKRG